MAKKIVVVNNYKAFPPVHGGQIAMNGLYGNLARWFDVEIIDFVDDKLHEKKRLISSNFVENSIYKGNIYKEELDFFKKEMIYYSGDTTNIYPDHAIFFDNRYKEVDRFVESVKKAAENAEIVIAEHPYTYKLIKTACPNKRIWYRAQNVESDYKNSTYDKLFHKEELVNDIFNIEKECCEGSDLILTITESDKSRLASLYGIATEKILTISAGYDFKEADFVLPSRRSKTDSNYEAQAFYISSYAEPAVDAAKKIIEFAKDLPNIKFVIAGSVQMGLKNIVLTDNVIIEETISNKAKNKYLKTLDFALNPIEGGSGMNIKMLEYFSYGIPVITSVFGSRGMEIMNGEEAIIENNDYHTAICNFLKMDIHTKDNIAIKAYKMLNEKYTWRIVAKKIVDYISEEHVFEFEYVERKVEFPYDPEYEYCNKGIIDSLNKNGCFIWGAGYFGSMCINLLKDFSIEVKGFVDNNKDKWGQKVLGHTIFSPEQFLNMKGNENIIAATSLSEEISLQLINLGIDKKDIFVFNNGEFMYL